MKLKSRRIPIDDTAIDKWPGVQVAVSLSEIVKDGTVALPAQLIVHFTDESAASVEQVLGEPGLFDLHLIDNARGNKTFSRVSLRCLPGLIKRIGAERVHR